MAAPVPTQIPTRLAAGDTLLFDFSTADYSAGAWTLTYYFQKLTPSFETFTFAATTNGSAFRTNVAAATTVLWTAGMYSGQAFVTAGNERYKVWEGQFEVLNNNALGQQTDIRSINRKTLDTLMACQLKLAAKQTARATIEGVDLFFKDPVALDKLIDKYQIMVSAEERRASGKQRPVILSRFTLP